MATAADHQIEPMLPAVAWHEIKAGKVEIQLEEKETRRFSVKPFNISRYPITNGQYQCFVDAGDYEDSSWWKDLKKTEKKLSYWQHSNRPRTNVCWYEAMAFCRWFSNHTGEEITLPTEQQWYLAGTGGQQKTYPWDDSKDTPVSNFANINGSGEDNGYYLAQTSAVGLYPKGDSDAGIADMAGNVWEWCLNEYDDIDQISPESSDDSPGPRVLRGGAWNHDPDLSEAATRNWGSPVNRRSYIGFRVVCARP